jgi:hypothetical protein
LGTSVTYATADQALAQLTGRWLDCTRHSAFGDDVDVGLEITADRFWYQLIQQSDGSIVRDTSPNHSGTVDLQPFGNGSDQIDLYVCNGEYIVHAQFWSNPRRMDLNNEGLWIGDYVPETP